MNKLIRAIKELDLASVHAVLDRDSRWATWSEANGKSALHYLCELKVAGDAGRIDTSLAILDLLLERGAGINSVHVIRDEGEIFSATPVWYAYTQGKNGILVSHLLARGADPDNCMFAIAWNDDIEAAELFRGYGAETDPIAGDSTPFFAAFLWRRLAIAEWFLQNGAAVDHADAKGNTALFYGVKRRYASEQIGLLLRFGADPSRKNAEGISPRDVAEQNHQRKLLGLLNPPAPVSSTE